MNFRSCQTLMTEIYHPSTYTYTVTIVWHLIWFWIRNWQKNELTVQKVMWAILYRQVNKQT